MPPNATASVAGPVVAPSPLYHLPFSRNTVGGSGRCFWNSGVKSRRGTGEKELENIGVRQKRRDGKKKKNKDNH
jgi:hypothetical protein